MISICYMLTAKQSLFIEAYKSTGNLKQAVIQAGYSPRSDGSLAVEANRLLKNPKISLELANWKLKKAKDLTKDDYVDIAMGVFKGGEFKEEPSRVRGLELVGKTLGYVGNDGGSRPNQTLNMQINVTGSELPPELWELTRKLIGN